MCSAVSLWHLVFEILSLTSFCRAMDKMILEEAYSNNAKPDKQARLDIVSNVSLNEKEVQVSSYIPAQNGDSNYELPRRLSRVWLTMLSVSRSGSRTDDKMTGENHVPFLLKTLQHYTTVL